MYFLGLLAITWFDLWLVYNTYRREQQSIYTLSSKPSLKNILFRMILLIDVSSLNAKVNDLRNLIEDLLDGQASILQQSGLSS